MAWDYARLYWTANGGSVSFTCQDNWIELPNRLYMDVLADLGAMGWELVGVTSEMNVQGSSGMISGATQTTSAQSMLVKRPWSEGSREAYVGRLTSWVIKASNRPKVDGSETQEIINRGIETGRQREMIARDVGANATSSGKKRNPKNPFDLNTFEGIDFRDTVSSADNCHSAHYPAILGRFHIRLVSHS